jgi:hypothetical protein
MDSKVLLILTASIGLLVILAIVFRKAIVLTFLKMVYGHYSHEFTSTYKKYFIRSPFQYCFRDDFVAHLLFVLSKKEGVPSYKSDRDIYFEDTPYFINYKEFLKQRGAPYCFNAFIFDKLDFEIKAVGYHAIVAGSKAVTVFYFMNDSFFMGEYIFKNPKTDIKSSFLNHFLELKTIEDDNFYIDNPKNRIIHYQDTGFTVDIKYLNREESSIIDNLTAYYNYLQGKREIRQQEDLN